ncbi:MAG: excinuclease ABC subunit UvrC [Candidatus Omnitrophica bacterium]|nr:excinuclease ABC subunit UvrC [Candidatus Omnitrophota bacterium]
MSKLEQKIKSLPLTSGVYLIKDGGGKILYIGKALSIKKRVQSYFSNRDQGPKIKILVQQISDVDYIETATEIDALLLEARLIRQYQPRYNKELKDDKSYPLLKITRELYPRVQLTRRIDKKGDYFGPYTDAKLLRQAINLIHSLFPVRKCQKLPKTACLYYHIGQCLAPCIKPEVQGAYDKTVNEVKSFLGTGKRSFMEYLYERMMKAAREYRYEDAQYFKEQMEALGKLKKKRFSIRKREGLIAFSATLELKKLLGMEKLPEKIVCFDVSNIHGQEAVASKVSFYRELPDKMEYRRYKIRTVKGIDDYAMIQEAVSRMLGGIKEGRENFIPDLVMIDGGKGHLNAAKEILGREGFESTALISLAKKFETVFSARTGSLLLMSKQSSALHLLQKIRDEAHRFAISYHRSLKEKALKKSVLDQIEGIGDKRKRILLSQFDSIEELKRAGCEQISGIPGLDRTSAARIWEFFHPHG